MKLKFALVALGALVGLRCTAQLTVLVGPVKVSGQKAVVSLALKNDLRSKVESARAVVFLLDERGKIAGQATQWVLGGSKTNGLMPGATNAFNFVVPISKPLLTTNLAAKVTFSRVVLEGNKLADISKDVRVTPSR